MNMDFAIQLAKAEAEGYANKRMDALPPDKQWAMTHVYNAYFAGYMQNAAERESLRAIVKRLEGKSHYTPPVEEIAGLDDLV